ncbi:membrane protein insertion efficiency factor YidD [Herbaspirillum sp. RV1423]|uniref:membrane protein insertion efficiency factor YidD n=1 Tax=Herbaspirillum sp. RV1423 TaxID=1443993 RepID=UPI0004B13FE1|nr:membrane protein insertion efficiency factor YidD [Herbaspirillum sp. RV1423]
MKTPLLLLLRAYKLGVSPYLGQNCRFYPSCSDYAAEAIRRHGAWKGSVLAGKRLCKCHPWHPGGLDPVPESTTPDSSPTVTADGCSHS